MGCGASSWTDALMKETETGAQHHSQLVRSSCSVEQKAQEDGSPHPGDSCCPISNASLPLKTLRLFIGGNSFQHSLNEEVGCGEEPASPHLSLSPEVPHRQL